MNDILLLYVEANYSSTNLQSIFLNLSKCVSKNNITTTIIVLNLYKLRPKHLNSNPLILIHPPITQ